MIPVNAITSLALFAVWNIRPPLSPGLTPNSTHLARGMGISSISMVDRSTSDTRFADLVLTKRSAYPLHSRFMEDRNKVRSFYLWSIP
jgi:hypothetical protein